MKALPFLLVPLFALSLTAFAQDDTQSPNAGPDPSSATSSPPPPHQAGVGKLKFMNADTNRDGRLSRDEAKAMPFVSRRFDAIDTDHDGYVTREELRAARQRLQAVRAQRAGKQPGNGDSANTN